MLEEIEKRSFSELRSEWAALVSKYRTDLTDAEWARILLLDAEMDRRSEQEFNKE